MAGDAGTCKTVLTAGGTDAGSVAAGTLSRDDERGRVNASCAGAAGCGEGRN